MSRKQFITLCGLSYVLPHKLCFEDFHAVVHDGDRIVIIGDNGSGKSSLMKIFSGENQSFSGKIQFADGLKFGYLPQDFDEVEESTVWEIATSLVDKEIQALKELDRLDPEKEAAAYALLLEELVSNDAFALEHRIEIVLDQMQL
ncbi:MAG: ATP-binding cassette domain-containing protein, partial [Chlamydiota bacterium]